MSRAPRRTSDKEALAWGRMLGRGVRKRCARCGGGDLFTGWFHQRERCPSCGMQFEREPGFFVGAYLINLTIPIVALFVVCMGLVAAKAHDPDAGIAAFVVVGALIAIPLPVVAYPYSRTVWSAIDLAMTPLELVEEAEAALAVAAAEGTAVRSVSGDVDVPEDS